MLWSASGGRGDGADDSSVRVGEVRTHVCLSTPCCYYHGSLGGDKAVSSLSDEISRYDTEPSSS